jgi:hypothetical protein
LRKWRWTAGVGTQVLPPRSGRVGHWNLQGWGGAAASLVGPGAAGAGPLGWADVEWKSHARVACEESG